MKYDDFQIESFWSKVDIKEDNQCWEWLGAKNSKGYGNIRINKEYTHAHRVAFEMHTGVFLNEKTVILHLCDNPECCNPSHLAAGTVKANSYDMIKKGREGFKKNKAIGERNLNSKLTTKDIIDIKKLINLGVNQYKIAEKFGVQQTTISSIKLGKTWRHINA